jgi:hypothetical protein
LPAIGRSIVKGTLPDLLLLRARPFGDPKKGDIGRREGFDRKLHYSPCAPEMRGRGPTETKPAHESFPESTTRTNETIKTMASAQVSKQPAKNAAEFFANKKRRGFKKFNANLFDAASSRDNAYLYVLPQHELATSHPATRNFFVISLLTTNACSLSPSLNTIAPHTTEMLPPSLRLLLRRLLKLPSWNRPPSKPPAHLGQIPAATLRPSPALPTRWN